MTCGFYGCDTTLGYRTELLMNISFNTILRLLLRLSKLRQSSPVYNRMFVRIVEDDGLEFEILEVSTVWKYFHISIMRLYAIP